MDGIDAILIGSIGVLAHCSELQWNLFNQSLREHVLDGHIKLAQGGDINRAGIEKGQVIWEKEAYIESLVQTGGSKRLKAYFEEKGLKDISDAAIKSVHVRKNDLFTEHIVDPSKGLVLRSGIMDMLVAAKKSGREVRFRDDD